ncbi:MAG: FAD-dependent oxidoreductase [Clostridia bacterium]|nr:FAD-dependent oxidoreductase [Clostridia bacterium]
MKDVIIVGAGPAGMSAAIYALRSGKSVLVLEGETIGGQMSNSPRIENFPTVKASSGSDLADKMFEQMTDLGAELELDKVVEVVKRGEGDFLVKCEYGEYEGKAVIWATGAKHRHIGVEGEEELIGNGVSYCALCDGAFFTGEDVVMIGDANTALSYTMFLSNCCRHVYICTLFDRFFGEKAMVDAVLARENVSYEHNLSLQRFLTDDQGKLKGLVFQNTKDGSERRYEVKGCFIAVGQVPNNDAIKGLVDLDKGGYVIAGEDTATKTAGLFIAGDCRAKRIRQVTTACADGSVAAIAATQYIDALK